MTKEQRTSLNILIDLAIRKKLDFWFRNTSQSIDVYDAKNDCKTVTVYYFTGEMYGYSQSNTCDDFKQAMGKINNYKP